MKKIRMTACVLILALVVCALAGCSNKNNTGMADEATTASQSASDGANGSMGESGTAANGMEAMVPWKMEEPVMAPEEPAEQPEMA